MDNTPRNTAHIPTLPAAEQAAKAAGFPADPNALLTREAAAAVLTAAGLPISPRTLATRATRGGGPPYCLFAGRALYRWGDALDWARSRMTPPRSSTSERDVRQGVA